METTPPPCFSCGRPKRQAGDICEYCADDPAAYTDPRAVAFDQAVRSSDGAS